MASGTSLSEYVLSITGVIVAASTSCFRNCRSALFGCNDHAQPAAHERRRHERSNRTIHASDPPTTPFAADEHERPTQGEARLSCDSERFPPMSRIRSYRFQPRVKSSFV